MDSGTVDWFPQLSPNDELANYISFPPGTLGHLPGMDVEVRLVRTANWRDVARALPALRQAGNH